MSYRSDMRCGVTLIEVLVVVAIVGLLSAIIIPAVQAARAVAAKGSCANNLRQLGLAILSYEVSVGCLPPEGTGRGFSMHAALLPFLGGKSIYNSINFSSQSFLPGDDNATALSATPQVFLCPADRLGGGAKGRINYPGNRGTGDPKAPYDGAFTASRLMPLKFSSFTDGTSNTALLCEWLVGFDDGIRRSTLRSVLKTSEFFNFSQHDQFAASCRGLDSASVPLNHSFKGRNWLLGDVGCSHYNHALTPNRNTCTNRTSIQDGAWTPGSLHHQGVNLLALDGHSVFLKNTISVEVWRALATRSGGELNSTDSY